MKRVLPRKTFRAKARSLVIGCVAALLTGCGERSSDALIAGVPSRPDVSAWPAEFAARIAKDENSVRANTNAVSALGDLATVYHANGFYAAAAQCYQALLRAEPNNPRWNHCLASILAGFGQLEAASPWFSRTIELAPDYLPARIRLGDIQLKLNDLETARKTYEQARQREPNHPHVLFGLARIEVINQDWATARKHLENAHSQSQGRIGGDLLVTVYQELGLLEKADDLRGRVKAAGSFSDVADSWIDGLLLHCYDAYRLASAAGVAELRGDTTTSVRLLERAIAVAPERTTARFQLGLLHVKLGELTLARTQFEECTSLAPDFADGWAQLASVLLKVGRGAEADRRVAQGLEHRPNSAGLHHLKANRLQEAGEIAQAEEEYREVIRLRPEEADPYVDLARLYFSSNRITDGRRELERAIAAEPQHPVALTTLAFHAIATGDENEATRWMQEVRNQPRIETAQRRALTQAFRQRFGKLPP